MTVDVARRIQRMHNRMLPPPGMVRSDVVLMFAPDGRFLGIHQGEAGWGKDPIAYTMQPRRVTEREVRAYLETLAGKQRTSLELYGSPDRAPIEEPVRR